MLSFESEQLKLRPDEWVDKVPLLVSIKTETRREDSVSGTAYFYHLI